MSKTVRITMNGCGPCLVTVYGQPVTEQDIKIESITEIKGNYEHNFAQICAAESFYKGKIFAAIQRQRRAAV